MLSLQLRSGDYLTIGDDIVIQIFRESSAQFRVSVQAPREAAILRGQVRERTGAQRPQGLRDQPPQANDLAALRTQLDRVAQTDTDRGRAG